jgi:hypothetical protein
MARKKAKVNGTPAEVVAPTITLMPNEDTPLFYVNHMEVANTVLDFTLLCTRLPAKLSPDKLQEFKEKKSLQMEAEVQVVFPASLARIMHHGARFCTSWRRSRAGDPSVWIRC